MTDRKEEFENAISYHKVTPEHGDVAMDFQKLRLAAKEFSDVVFDITDPSREQSLSLTHIEEALMWATKQVAITRLPVAEPLS